MLRKWASLKRKNDMGYLVIGGVMLVLLAAIYGVNKLIDNNNKKKK
jgi:hypothetical protein